MVEPSNLFIERAVNILNTLASLIAENYSLNPQIDINKILDFALKVTPTDCDRSNSIKDATSKVIKFINYEINDFKNIALSIDELENIVKKRLKRLKKNVKTEYNKNKVTKEEEIEECKLVLMFFPNYNNENKYFFEKLADLVGVDHKGIDLWLAEAEGNVGKIVKLISDNAHLNNVPLMREDHFKDIERILKIEIFKYQYDYFKGKENDKQIKFINTLTLQDFATARCKVSQIYVASMLLTFAVFEQNMEMVKVLLEFKADPRIKDLKYGLNSISYALLTPDFSEEFLKEAIKDKYKLIERKAECDGALFKSITFIDEYQNKDKLMQMLRKLYDFDFEDDDD
ncbi:uncharacterized protein LOC124817565 [Hydra vulgaris]|uniref:uncharacterized protein LOC124817565 n=1 Tax=Hydra vulgaris TaxID=6087 RepID=UPI001F5F8935|nr:uncharacterized protein LOC124817565 [Hydra vulgaris]XP_047143767.1 uncharacterized protein LOC124817565 [Hydra vulgaris]XP_047143768.1 uncharacterized protein LOC124817565 [Hydra vulgaris]XP_047143769.1 uncharacterized protein LOC124817565 [Hydra vulgaris]